MTHIGKLSMYGRYGKLCSMNELYTCLLFSCCKYSRIAI